MHTCSNSINRLSPTARELTDSSRGQNKTLALERSSIQAVTGFISGNKGGKSVIYKQTPINFADRNSGITIYESQDFLKYIKFEYSDDLYSYVMTL